MSGPGPLPASLPGVLHRLAGDPRPRLTWYGPHGERVELSGHVLDNWVTKTANLLVEEYSAGPGTRVLLDLPPHWRAVVWALGVWRVGACVVLGGPSGGTADPEVPTAPSDLVVTSRPDAHAGVDADVVAVALPALARRFDGPLPVGTVDAAAAVMTYGDVLAWMPDPEPQTPAVARQDQSVPHDDLIGWAVGTARDRWPVGAGAARLGSGAAVRVMVETSDEDVQPAIAAVLAVLSGGGSVVLCAPSASAELAADPRRRERLVETERVGAALR